MPNWPTRFLHPTSSSPRISPSPSSDEPPISAASLLEDSTSSLISPHTRPRHSRSISHQTLRSPRIHELPHRTLLSHRGTGDFSTAVDIRPPPDGKNRAMPPPGRSYMKRPMERPAEMTTGPCVCCASTVKWPEDLSQFRCTICRTVNTVNHPESLGSTQESITPLSVGALRTIIEQSKRGFLSALVSGSFAENTLMDGGLAEKQYPISAELSGFLPQEISPDPKETIGNTVSSSPNVSNRTSNYIKLAADAFDPLEEYIRKNFSSWQCLNTSFSPITQETLETCTGDPKPRNSPPRAANRSNMVIGDEIPVTKTPGEKETNMLKMGHVLRRERANTSSLTDRLRDPGSRKGSRSLWRISPIDWKAVKDFYDQLLGIGNDIVSDLSFCRQTLEKAGNLSLLDSIDQLDLDEIEIALHEARVKVLNEMLRATESLLKRPGRPLSRPEDVRFLLILLVNPLLSPSSAKLTTSRIVRPSMDGQASPNTKGLSGKSNPDFGAKPGGPGHNSFVLKRLYGLLSNLTNECHRYILSWTSVAPAGIFREMVEIGGTFTTYRIQQVMSKKNHRGRFPYSDDWQLKAVARVMALLEKANNDVLGKRSRSIWYSRDDAGNGEIPPSVHIVPVNLFYNMRLDYLNVIADFEAWEKRESKFCFCQYPFYLSMGAKATIIDHDSKRQMEIRARTAFINNISSRTAFSAYMNLKVRRDCIVEDSLKGIGESVGTLDEHKKGLRVEFVNEDGIDAGGLRKEWFLLLAREVFDPRYGLFVCEEDSNYCYFNPHSLESSEDFYLVGVLLGLAIYNSTILDVPLPPYLFRKLVANPPYPEKSQDPAFHRRESPPLRRTLADLAVIRPSLARGLKQLLDYDGDVESTFCRNFIFEDDRYGEKTLIDLGTDGRSRPVTNENRHEFVDRYVKHILDDAVTRQFDPFRRGFYIACGGNALGLLGPEELELIIRGSAEPLDVHALKAVAIYEGFGPPTIAEQDTVVRWFWGFFEKATPEQQRMLLSFITGSDRIPATGATSLIIKVTCIGPDCDRFPVARTCFNMICLYRYRRREKFENMLWRAVTESEGFGLK